MYDWIDLPVSFQNSRDDSPKLLAEVGDGVTLSAGAIAVVTNAQTSLSEMLGRSDEALYAAKRGGRNRVEMLQMP